ncbi:MAG TPA: tRNA pseudouridine(55) synthase TruB [Spirochaetia bacterium]
MTDGIILLDKAPGQTSFQSLGELKRRLGTTRVGHTGTLDRFAEGLLVVLAGRMTRLCPYATSMDKEYVAEVTFGRGTDTLDPEGETTVEGRVPDRAEIEAALPGFRGEMLQVPPAFSAIHVGGRRAYDAARRGEDVALAPRAVTVAALDLLDWRPPVATLRVSCSKGTYIRSLARDIAARIGTCAFVSGLRRTRVGGFRVEDAHPADSFDPTIDLLPPAAFFDAAPGLGRLTVVPDCVGQVANGAALSPRCFREEPGEGTWGAFAPDGDLLAVVESAGGRLRYAAAFPPETAK